MKFKILPKVDGFRDAQDVYHLPGEIVDLPATYEGESWLERVDKPAKVEVPPAKVERVLPLQGNTQEAPEVKPTVPFEAKKSRKTK